MMGFHVWSRFSQCMYVTYVTDLQLLIHSWERAGHSNRCTCWVWNRSHRHMNSCKLLEDKSSKLAEWIQLAHLCFNVLSHTWWNKQKQNHPTPSSPGLCGITSRDFKEGGTYERYTGSLLAESSSLDSSMSGSESHTHWAWRRQDRKNKQTH